MMRYAHHAFVFIDDPVTEDECGTNFHAGEWDPDHEWCWRLFYVDDAGDVDPIKDDLADALWEPPYGIDKLEAYRNAYDCWYDNEGKPGETEFLSNLEDGAVPPCFFSMEVAKGTFRRGSLPGEGGFIEEGLLIKQEEGEKWDARF